MTSSRTVQSQAVTRAEFNTFAKHMESSIAGVNANMTAISQKMDQRTQPQYGLLISLVGLIISLVGGGYFIVTSQIESSEKLAAVMDENLQQQILFQREDNKQIIKSVSRLEALAESK